MQQFQALWLNLNDQIGHARQIAARSVQVSDEAKPDRVGPYFKDNRNGCCGCLCRERRRSSGRSYHVYISSNQIGCHRGQPIDLFVRPAVVDGHVLALDKAGFL
jgi:hypothetical protein